ncbi:MAG TPA: HEAT repeat domain-containing protein [Anaerolineales bacterium]|jgi:hypothetical protein
MASRNRTRFLLSLVILILTSQSCAPAAEPSPTIDPNPVDPGILNDLASFGGTLNPETAFQTLHENIRDNPSELARAAMQQLENADPAVRFAAIYALANTAETQQHLDGLRSLLSSQSAGERLLAAEALLVRGEKEAIPVLIAALNSEEELAYSLPPQQAWQAASSLLLLYTLEDFGLAGADTFELVAVTQPAWQAWWEQQGGNLQWMADLGVYQ